MALNFHSTGKPVTESDISAVESRLGITLPADYRGFLLKHNGGEIEPEMIRFTYEEDGEPGEAEVTSFQSIGADEPQFDLETTTLFQRDELELPAHLIPIAFCDEDEILLAVGGEDLGKVYYWYIIEGGFDGEHFQFVANSFQEFLDSLEPAE